MRLEKKFDTDMKSNIKYRFYMEIQIKVHIFHKSPFLIVTQKGWKISEAIFLFLIKYLKIYIKIIIISAQASKIGQMK